MLVYKGAFYQMFLVFVFIILHPLLSWQKRPYLFPESYVKLKNLKCDFEPNWIANVSCKLKPISWEMTMANISFDLLQPLANYTLHIQAFRLETQYIPYLINIRINACDMLQRKGIDFYSRIVHTFINQFMNIKNPTCPLMGHLEFRNAYLKGSYVIVPPGTYKLIFTSSKGNPPDRVFVVTAFANVVEKRRKFE